MAGTRLQFEDAESPGQSVVIEADTQVVVTPGDRPGTAIITTPGGKRTRVVGDYRDIHVRVQAAAAAGHESGAAPQANTPVS